MAKNTKLSESLEDYLEVILALELTKKVARAKDIAENMGVKSGSVTSALKNLEEKGMIITGSKGVLWIYNENPKLKRAIEKAMGAGAQGIKIMVGGRLGGAEIARSEWLKEGRIPLQTFRADIDYGFTEAYTTMGHTGIKVWIFKKEFFKKTEAEMREEAKLIEKDPQDIEPNIEKPKEDTKTEK